MKSFKNKIVWITGASSGIGEALAYAFAREGAKLILSSRRKEELERVKVNCGLSEENILILPLDLSLSAEMNTAAKAAVNRFKKIDVIVNNGGISQRSLVKDTPLEIDRKIMEVNFFGTIALTKAVLPYMLEQKDGHIIVISSIAGKFGYYFRSAYSASKHALHGFFEAFRMELSDQNIKVTIVCPGKIKTDISLNALKESGEKNNRMDKNQENGMSAEKCAQQILDAVKKNKDEIFVGGKELIMVRLKRFFPKLFSTLIKKVKPE